MKKEVKSEEKPQSTMQNADDLLIKAEQEKLGKVVPEIPVVQKEKKEEQSEEPTIESKSKIEDESKSDEVEELKEETEDKQESKGEELESKSSEDTAQDNQIDEYGNKVGKKRLYTDEDVQK